MIKITDVEKVTEETLERDFAEFEKSELGDLKEQNKDVCRHCGKRKDEHLKDGNKYWCGYGKWKEFEPEPLKEEAIKRIKSFLAMRKAEGKTNVSVMEIAEITKVDAELVEEIMNETEGVKEAQDEEKKVICDMCEAENDSDSINCKMCKRELKGAIRTVAGSMPAAAINEEQAIAEFTAKKVIIKKCAANLRQLAEELSENVKNPKDIQYIMSDLLSHARLFDMIADELEQAARNLLHNQAQAIFADIRKKVSEHSDVVTNMHMMHENDIIELEKKWKASGK